MRRRTLKTISIGADSRLAGLKVFDVVEQDGGRAFDGDIDETAAPFPTPPAFDEFGRFLMFGFAHPSAPGRRTSKTIASPKTNGIMSRLAAATHPRDEAEQANEAHNTLRETFLFRRGRCFGGICIDR